MAGVKHTEYWWASEDATDVVNQLYGGNSFDQAWANNPMYQTFYRNMYIYFSNVIKPTDWNTGLVFTGRQGELVEMMVPMARSLVRQLIGILTKQRLAFSCLAETTSQNVIETTRLGNALSKQIVRDQMLDSKFEMALEHHFLTGLGFLYAHWRTDKGKPWTKDGQGVQHFTGDLEITAPTVWDIVFDPAIPDPADWDWVQVRQIHNRWDLIAQHMDLKEEILNLPSVREAQGRFMYSADVSPSDADMVYIYSAYHKISPSMPEGRFVAYGDVNTVLFDGPNHYGELPIYVCRAEPIPQTSFGFPFFSSLVPLQEMLDTTLSSIATNNSTFGVQSIAAPRGSGINVTQIVGMNFFEYTPMEGPGGGKPEPLQLTQSSPESYKFAEVLKSYLQELSLINSAMRGDPPPGVTSGTAIATLTATALESINAAAKSARDMVRRCMLGSINCYRRFASVERDVKVSGMGGQTYSKGFTGSDLDPIKDIDISEVNPLMQTLSGRIDIAEKLAAQGMVKNIKGYFAVLEGAPPEELYKNELSEEDLVNRENEALLNGEPVVTMNVDDHPYHIMMHSMLLNDPKVRLEGQMVQSIMAHILEHNDLARAADPFFTAMVRTGKMPEGGPPPPPMPGVPPGMEGGPGGPPMQPGKTPGARPESKGGVGSSEGPAKPAQDLLARGEEVA